MFLFLGTISTAHEGINLEIGRKPRINISFVAQPSFLYYVQYSFDGETWITFFQYKNPNNRPSSVRWTLPSDWPDCMFRIGWDD